MKKSMHLVIFRGNSIQVPYKVLIAIAVISFILTAGILWAINYFNMIRFLILILPAYFANMMAFWSMKVPFLEPLGIPIDFNYKWVDGKRIFGNSKTFRGFLIGILTALMIAYISYLATSGIGFYSSREEALFFGLLAGSGAMSGDLVRSFFKRRVGLKSGENWFLFDDLDFIIGALLLLGIYIKFPIFFVILTFIGTLTLRLLSNAVDFIFNIKKPY